MAVLLAKECVAPPRDGRFMRNSAAERLDAVPSAEGGMTRLAFACAQEKGADVDTLLRKAGLRSARHSAVLQDIVRLSMRVLESRFAKETKFMWFWNLLEFRDV